jgi:hypothetical protein
MVVSSEGRLWLICWSEGISPWFNSGADYFLPTDWSQFPSPAEHVCADPTRLRELYKVQKEVPGYRNILANNVTIFGTFDGMYAWRRELLLLAPDNTPLNAMSPFVAFNFRPRLWLQ